MNFRIKSKSVIRKKSEREKLNGYDCPNCEKFYKAAIEDEKERKRIIQKCSRHRCDHSPPSTPPEFWELEDLNDEKDISSKSLSF